MTVRRALALWLVLVAGCAGPSRDDAPEAFTDRPTLPDCGTITYDGAGVLSTAEEGAEQCFRGAAERGLGAELEVVHFTEQGDPVRTYLRAIAGTAGLEVFIDSTETRGGDWSHRHCGGLSEAFPEAVDCRPVTG